MGLAENVPNAAAQGRLPVTGEVVAETEPGIQVPDVPVLDVQAFALVIVVAESEVQGEPGEDLPRILDEERRPRSTGS